MTDLKVKDDLVVSLDYALHLGDGQVVDSSARNAPLEFLQGHGQIIRGLEQELYGMAVGEEKSVVLPPADAYGEIDPNAFQSVPRDAFPPDLELTPGKRLHVRDESGDVFTTYVDEVQPDSVVLDFNHPLAGETLHFDIKIADLRRASSEELAHGHVHGDGDED